MIFEGFSYPKTLPQEGTSCYLKNSTTLACGDLSFTTEFVLNQRNLTFKDKHLILIDSNPGTRNITDIFDKTERKIQIFTINSQHLRHHLKEARCLECNHEKSNRCKNMLFTAGRPKKCSPLNEGYSCQSKKDCIEKLKGNLCKNETCFKEVLWLGFTPKHKNLILSNPKSKQEGKKYETCHLENIPSYLKTPLVSVTNGTIRACGETSDGKKCLMLQDHKWNNFQSLVVVRNEAAGITFGNGSWWITGGETTDGKALSTSEILHSGTQGNFFHIKLFITQILPQNGRQASSFQRPALATAW